MTALPPTHPLAGIQAKISRADIHLHALEQEAGAFIKSHPYFLTLEPDPDSGRHVIRAKVHREPPLALGVILGDFLHDLRSALDHLVWQLVVIIGTHKPGRWNSFPIYDDPGDFRDRVTMPRSKGKKSPLLGVDDQTFAVIERLQPYHELQAGELHGLWVLSVLSNVDKHQLVHAVLGAFADSPPDLSVVSGSVRELVLLNVAIEDGAEVGYLVTDAGSDDAEVEMQGTLPADMRFGEMQIPGAKLHELRDVVVTTLNIFTQGFGVVTPD